VDDASRTSRDVTASTPAGREGTIDFYGFPVWFRVVGADASASHPPLLCLHGGPGAPSDYLEPFGDLATTGREVVFYDQLGCGNSGIASPHDPAMWTTDLFVEEIDAVRTALGLDRVHLLGQSWGGMLAMQYALTQPAGVLSLVIESSPASMTQWVSEANRLRSFLPADVEATLRRHEADGTTDDPGYEEAMMAYYRRHLCRLDPWPDYVQRTFDKLAANSEVYNVMNGPSEFHVTGLLKDWDIVGRLGEIEVSTLVMSGRHDEATPTIAETVHNGIAGSEWVLFEESSHMCHAEERERCMEVVGEFLSRVEAPTP
jgi:proline-specific peptidase